MMPCLKNLKERGVFMKKYPKTMGKIREFMEIGVYPGFSVAFIEGEEVEKIVEGTLTNEANSKLVEDGLFYDLASVTKAFVTSTLLVQMVEKKEIDLDQSMSELLVKS